MQRRLDPGRDATIIPIETEPPRPLLSNISQPVLSHRSKPTLTNYSLTPESSHYARSIYIDLSAKPVLERENPRISFARVNSQGPQIPHPESQTPTVSPLTNPSSLKYGFRVSAIGEYIAMPFLLCTIKT